MGGDGLIYLTLFVYAFKFNCNSSLDFSDMDMYVIVTKIDTICTETMANTEYAMQSPEIEEVIENLSGVLGILRKKVYPLRNYVEQNQRDRGIEILALAAMRSMLDTACSYVRDCMVEAE